MRPEVASPPGDDRDAEKADEIVSAPSISTMTPRSLRVMARIRWILLAIVTVVAGYSVWTIWGRGSSSDALREQALYYCPMHPQIRSPDPGECPICHMHLELIPVERRPGATSNPKATMMSGTATLADVTAVSLSTEKQQAVGLMTTMATHETLGSRVRVPAVISAPETGLSQVRVRAAGFVEQVAVRQTGVRVVRGQPLAWVYSPEVYRAQSEFVAATRWPATADGVARPAGSTDLVSAARRALELLGMASGDIDEIARTGQPLRAIPVRAPSAGYVTRFNAVPGARADPDTVLYEISDLSTVWIVASVHERDIDHLHAGMSARFSWSSNATDAIGGRISLIEPALDEATRTTRVRVVVTNKNGRFRPGQFGEVEFELSATEGLFVPRDAVIRTGKHEYVYLAQGVDRFEPRSVRTGLGRDGRVQILEGVVPGERVVTRGSFMLDSESRLQASLAATPPALSPSVGTLSADQGPPCDAAFDREQYPDKQAQCQACERQHAGMGSMVADCKNAIPRPWR